MVTLVGCVSSYYPTYYCDLGCPLLIVPNTKSQAETRVILPETDWI